MAKPRPRFQVATGLRGEWPPAVQFDADASRAVRKVCKDPQFASRLTETAEVISRLAALRKNDMSRPSTPGEVGATIRAVGKYARTLKSALDTAGPSATGVLQSANVDLDSLAIILGDLLSVCRDVEALNLPRPATLAQTAAGLVKVVFREFNIPVTNHVESPAVRCTTLVLEAAHANCSAATVRSYFGKAARG